MTTALDLIIGALRRINCYTAGEVLSAADANDGLDTLNDLLDSLSNDEASIFSSSENIFNFIPGQNQYSIGNYPGGTFGGTLTSGSNVIAGVTLPALLKVRADVTDTQAGIPAGTTVTALGANTVTLSAPATQSIATTVSYTVPGDFKTQRPLRVSDSFTRINTTSGIDYPIKVVSQETYIKIGYKAIPAPWPIALWYNPTMPLGTLFFYQTPSGTGELHLFTDTILSNLNSLTAAISMPQGYSRYLKWKLAAEMAPEYGADWTPKHERALYEAESFVKALNQVPAAVAQFDEVLLRRGGRDAGGFLYGWFR